METYVIPEMYENRRDLLWVNFIAKEMLEQKAYARGSSQIATGEILGAWKLLSSREIVESVSHEWSEYESIGSRLSQKVGEIKTGIKELGALKSGAIKGAGEFITGSPESAARAFATGLTSSTVPKWKVDTSLVYKDSKRLEYSMTFHLAQTPGKSSYTGVYKPVRKLEELSCASLAGDFIGINFPAVFRIFTSPSDIINIRYAALTAVQPTWRAPYKNGYPMSCELQLTFVDIEPLYKKTFEGKGRVRTS